MANIPKDIVSAPSADYDVRIAMADSATERALSGISALAKLASTGVDVGTYIEEINISLGNLLPSSPDMSATVPQSTKGDIFAIQRHRQLERVIAGMRTYREMTRGATAEQITSEVRPLQDVISSVVPLDQQFQQSTPPLTSDAEACMPWGTFIER